MEELFRNKYRIKSTRLNGWDYSSDGAYFITICTKNRKCIFGNVVHGEIKLSAIGKIVANEWIKTEQIRTYIQLDEWIVMPNHFHAILFINNLNVETCRGMSLQKYNQFSKPISQSLSMIINHFKSAVIRSCKKNGFVNFQWQSRFHDHIIRNEKELNNIRTYITNNSLQWEFDENNLKKNKREQI